MPEIVWHWDFLVAYLNGGKDISRIALFLDFDGTLTPIVRDPFRCSLSDEMKGILLSLIRCERVSLSIISGRSLGDLRRRVGLRNIYYAGNHGLDIAGPGMRFIHPGAVAALPLIDRAARRLGRAIRNIKGAWLENKKYTVSLHYRGVGREEIPFVKRLFYERIGDFLDDGSLDVIKGKKVIELRPAVAWDKGKAVLSILKEWSDSLAIFIGDDLTDETAFTALAEKGITIRVGKSGKTSARYYLERQSDVTRFLALLLERLSERKRGESE